MKKLLILILALSASYSVFGQQKGKTDYMSISIYQQAARFSNMVVTRTDSAQKIVSLKIKLPLGSTGFYAEQDSDLLQILKPYTDQGWKIISFAIDHSIMNGNDYGQAFKYYLSKDE